MRIRVAFEVPCSADAAWEALHTPTVASELYRPLLHMRGIREGLPARFVSGDTVDVSLRAFGRFPVGTQRIAIFDVATTPVATGGHPVAGSRTMRDAGKPLTGPLTLLRFWNHEVSVWPKDTGSAQHGPAVWHDELTIQGHFAPLFALLLYPMWWWRGRKLRRLARGWDSITLDS